MAASSPRSSFLATRRGKLTLALLCVVAFLDFVDASIVNVALPSIRRDLHSRCRACNGCSRLPAHYGGFLLLGAAPAICSASADPRRGNVAVCARFARRRPCRQRGDAGGARLAQGLGAAMMLPGGAFDPDNDVQRGHRPSHGARRLGCDAGLGAAVGVFWAECSPRGLGGAG